MAYTGDVLLIPLDAPGIPLHRQLYERLRERILDGRLKPGERLPSTRSLAQLLGVGRNTVVEAFEMLLAEGYLETRRGSGTYVTPDLPDSPRRGTPSPPSLPPPALAPSAWARRALASQSPETEPAAHRATIQLRNGLLPSGPFPWKVLERLLRAHLAARRAELFQYGHPAGLPALRQAIAEYVARARGVHCGPEHVLVTSGSQGVLDLVARVLLEDGDVVAMEDPGYGGARRAFAAAGARLVPVPVDAAGLRPEHLPARAKLVYLTPSHQFPTGGVLPAARRLAVLEWARASGAWVVEDDYDSEYRYSGRPLAALQGLAPERVLYCGTFSKALYPGLRLGFLVAPREVIETLSALRYLIDRQPPTLEQLVLTDFLCQGHFARHLRQLRALYAAKRRALLAALAEQLPEWRWRDAGAGLHLYVRLPDDLTEDDVIARAAAVGIGLYGASAHYLDPASAPPGLVLGYAHLEPAAIRACIARLGRALRSG